MHNVPPASHVCDTAGSRRREMFHDRRVRFLQEREGLTLQSGKILDTKLIRSQYLPIEKGTVFADKLWQLFRSINTGLERPEGYFHESGGSIMPLSMLLVPMEPPFLPQDQRAQPPANLPQDQVYQYCPYRQGDSVIMDKIDAGMVDDSFFIWCAT